jgi:diaminopimelate decarboxylase
VHASTHEYLATAREDQKFGIPASDAPAAVAAIRSHPSLRFLGLHSHIGSQIFESAGFAEAARRLLALHAELLAGGEIPELNLGGGFGIAYTSVDEVAPIEQLADELAQVVGDECARLGIPVPAIAIEPGRAVIGPAGVTLYEVGTVKDVTVDDRAVRRYVSVDGGMSDNLRTALYHADYTVRIANRTSDADAALVRVAGKHCESGDIVVRDDYLPGDVQPGDLLAVAATGAYCWSLSSNYNYLGRPAVIAVRDGGSHVLVRRENEHDLLRRDAGYSSAAEDVDVDSILDREH